MGITDELKERMALGSEKYRRERLEAGLKTTKTPFEKLSERPNSLRLAIDAMCWDCQGRDADPGVKWRIGNCVSLKCPLYAVRPYQRLYGTEIPVSLVVR